MKNQNTTHLSRQEIDLTYKFFNELCESEDKLTQELEDRFDNAAVVRQELEDGVDRFYQLYSSDVTRDTLCETLEESMDTMNNLQKYKYLSNVLLAITHVGGNVYEGAVWADTLEEHQTVLTAIEMGLYSEDSDEVQNGIDEMLEHIMDNVEAFSVILIDDPAFAKLQEACITEDPAKVQALAANTRQASINMAAALYILQKDGKLPSLNGTRYTPRDMGVITASLLEIDAAQKSGSWETAKKVIIKATRIATLLLLASPAIILSSTLLAIVGLLTNFATLWMLISGAILLTNLHVHMQNIKDRLSPVLQTDARLLDTTLDTAKSICTRFSSWIQSTILPQAKPVWDRCRTFAMERVIVPAAAWIIKAKEIGMHVASTVWMKLKDAANRVFTRVPELFNNVIARAQTLDASVGTDIATPVANAPAIVDTDIIEEPEEDLEEETDVHDILV